VTAVRRRLDLLFCVVQSELISGDRDGIIRVWDLTQNACSAELVPDGSKAIRSVRHAPAVPPPPPSPPSLSLVHCCAGAPPRLLAFPHPSRLLSPSPAFSISNDATLLAAANDFGSVFVWRLGGTTDAERSKKFEPLQKLQAHSTYITKCLISPDGKRLATSSSVSLERRGRSRVYTSTI
jgi:G protein beta subunit-like protein